MIPFNAGNTTGIEKVEFEGKVSKMENWNYFPAFSREGSYYENISIICWLICCQKNQLVRKHF